MFPVLGFDDLRGFCGFADGAAEITRQVRWRYHARGRRETAVCPEVETDLALKIHQVETEKEETQLALAIFWFLSFLSFWVCVNLFTQKTHGIVFERF